MSDDTPSRTRDARELARYTAAFVVIAAFVALAALAIAASRSSLSLGAPAAQTHDTAQLLPEVPALSAIDVPPPAAAPGAAAPAAVTAVSPAMSPAVAQPDVPAPALPVPAGKPCAAFSLPAPQQVGGLQSLIRLVPLFGPFSPEAFAMLPAFQPGFAALGPLFPLFGRGLDAAAPALDALTPVVTQLSEAGFGALAPLYGPYREDVLAGEAQLAAYLQPIVQSLADAPGSECLVALEGVLASLQPGAQ